MMRVPSKDEFSKISRGFDPEPQKSLSLNADAYVDPLWFEMDQQAIIARSWQWVCHVEKVREPGSYFSTTIAGKISYQISHFKTRH